MTMFGDEIFAWHGGAIVFIAVVLIATAYCIYCSRSFLKKI